MRMKIEIVRPKKFVWIKKHRRDEDLYVEIIRPTIFIARCLSPRLRFRR